MKNIMEIDGQKTIIQYDPEIDLFRGEFLDLNGGADFYARDVEGLHQEGRKSLQVFLAYCAEKGVAPHKRFSGRFNIRLSPELHAKAACVAAANDMSLNQLVSRALELEVADG